MPRCIGEHEGENYPIKEIFGEPFNFIVLNLKDKTSIGGWKWGSDFYLVTDDLKGDLTLGETPMLMPEISISVYLQLASRVMVTLNIA